MDSVENSNRKERGKTVIQFEFLKVYNFMDAIRGMRNSYESWDRMDSMMILDEFEFGPNDYKLAMTLSKAGKAHDKFLRQIFVSVDIIAPEYFWKEMDMYHFFETNSTSMMHTLGNKELTKEDFSFDYLDEDYIDYLNLINRVREKWIAAGKIKHSRCPHWRKMNQLMSIAFLYRRTTTLNYAQLKSIVQDRKNHRLSEWWGFYDWVCSLPYSELITLNAKGGE